MKTLWWDDKDKTIRGSFINLVLTAILMTLIIIGAFNDGVAARLVKLTELITFVFVISFGGWRAGKYFTEKNKVSEKENG